MYVRHALKQSSSDRLSDSANSIRRWLPPVTLGLTALCLALFCLPNLSQRLQFDRDALAIGQLWRILTGHLTHWGLEHLLWDTAVFAVLAFLCERRYRGRCFLCLTTAALLIPLSVWLLLPTITTYRGLSGINAALFTLLAGRILVEKWAAKDLQWVIIMASLMIGFCLKVFFEFLTGESIFVDSTSANFQTIPLAHAVGALAGIIFAALPIGKWLDCKGP